MNRPGERAGPQVILRVADVIRVLRGIVRDDSRLQDLWVSGEISDVFRSGAGHIYFTLNDYQDLLKCVMFAREAAALATPITEGLTALCRGRVDLYPEKGAYQLYVEELQPLGQGVLSAQYQALKRRLATEGLFVEEAKRPLPRLPAALAVVTSPSGAAIRDVLQVLRRRCPGCAVTLCPCPVEGQGAHLEVVRALRQAGEVPGAELVLLVRGGGSPADLWPFETEEVVRAIRRCPIPVVTGIGHQVDVTLADFAADLRAATPSVAAELAVPDAGALLVETRAARRRLDQALGRDLTLARTRLGAAASALGRVGPARLVAMLRQSLDNRRTRLERALLARAGAGRLRLDLLRGRLEARSPRHTLVQRREAALALAARLEPALVRGLRTQDARFNAARDRLELLSPVATVRRGYTLTHNAATGELIRSAGQATAAGLLRTVFAQGEVTSRVEETVNDD
ncbi:MAG: exodeoxyribonuclease VII large subunit [Candidatus Dormibacteria bacterium]